MDYPMIEGAKNFTRDPNGLPVMETITEGPQIFIYVKYNYQTDNMDGTYNKVATNDNSSRRRQSHCPNTKSARQVSDPNYGNTK